MRPHTPQAASISPTPFPGGPPSTHPLNAGSNEETEDASSGSHPSVDTFELRRTNTEGDRTEEAQGELTASLYQITSDPGASNQSTRQLALTPSPLDPPQIFPQSEPAPASLYRSRDGPHPDKNSWGAQDICFNLPQVELPARTRQTKPAPRRMQRLRPPHLTVVPPTLGRMSLPSWPRIARCVALR